jgi:soluble lytic murein transglycosylase-like protein
MVWDAEVRSAAAHWASAYGVTVDPALVHGVIERESGHGRAPNYVAHNGVVPEPGGHFSYGPMQVYDDTVTTVLKLGFPGSDLATHPELGIWYGTKYLATLLKRFAGDVDRAVAAYNAGPNNAVRSAAGSFPNQQYVNAVNTFAQSYRGPGIVPVLTLAAVVMWMMSRRA